MYLKADFGATVCVRSASELGDLAQNDDCARDCGGGSIEQFVNIFGRFELLVLNIREADEWCDDRGVSVGSAEGYSNFVRHGKFS